MNLKCDNRQTISLIIKEEPPFSTRLRHVDIHRYWLRQKAPEKRAQVAWVPTTSMAADDLTKALPLQRYAEFINMLGIHDMNGLITA